MNSILEQMLNKYDAVTLYDKKNAVKEIIQEVILCGLARAGFFKQAAFYGGTALRIFYGLDRFSEDLDFSLMTEDLNFDLTSYFPVLEKEVRAFGLNMTVSEKEKKKDSNIRSAFLKGNTKEHLLLFYADEKILGGVAPSELIKIKFEIDVNPPRFATFEHKFRLQPAPYEVNLYDMSSLFAGKVHAVICRSWQNRVKGRDLYDFVFYLSQGAKLNLPHLRERLLQSNYIREDAPCGLEDIKRILGQRFDSIDYEEAKEDVLPFIRDASAIELWSADFFKQITTDMLTE